MKRLKLSNGATGFYDENNQWKCTGSSMGRRSTLPLQTHDAQVKLQLQLVPMIDNDAYDRWGAYWGGSAEGNSLYCAWGDYEAEDMQVRVFVRARNRAHAKAQVREKLPLARFYR